MNEFNDGCSASVSQPHDHTFVFFNCLEIGVPLIKNLDK